MTKIDQAKRIFDEGNHQKAIDILEKENELKQDNQVIAVLIHFYVALKQYSLALKLIYDQKVGFVDEQNCGEDYFQALLGTNNFILARKWLCRDEMDVKQQASLEQAEDEYQKVASKSIMENEKNFYHIGDQSLILQDKIMERAYHLPINNFKRAARFNLIDPYLNQLTRISILKDLCEMNVDEELEFIWIDDQKHAVNPAKIETKKMLAEIKNEIISDNNVVQNKLILQQASLLFELAFPFPKEIFETSLDWSKALKRQYLNYESVEQFKRLDEIVQNIRF